MCIRLRAENVGYDEKHLIFADEKNGGWDSFNCYYIAAPFEMELDKNGRQKTTWYLCDYDGVNSVIL